MRCFRRGGPLPSEEGTTPNVLGIFTESPEPESGLDCLVCAMLARQRGTGLSYGVSRSVARRTRSFPKNY